MLYEVITVYDVHLRGMDAPDPNGLVNWTSNSLTLVMVNNRIVYNEYQGNISWELLQISIDDIVRGFTPLRAFVEVRVQVMQVAQVVVV